MKYKYTCEEWWNPWPSYLNGEKARIRNNINYAIHGMEQWPHEKWEEILIDHLDEAIEHYLIYHTDIYNRQIK